MKMRIALIDTLTNIPFDAITINESIKNAIHKTQKGLYTNHPFFSDTFIFTTELLKSSINANHENESQIQTAFIGFRAFKELGARIDSGSVQIMIDFLTSRGAHKLHDAINYHILHSSCKHPKPTINKNTTYNELHGMIDTILEEQFNHKLNIIRNTPEALSTRAMRAALRQKLVNTNNDYKFSVANATTALSLFPSLKTSPSLQIYWRKVLCTSINNYPSRAAEIRPVDITEIIEEFESITIDHELKTLALSHLRKLFVIAQKTWGKFKTKDILVKNMDGENGESIDIDAELEELLKPLQESNQINLDAAYNQNSIDSPIKERRSITLSNGKQIFFPHRGDYPTSAQYFEALAKYRIIIKEEQRKEQELKQKNRAIMRAVKNQALIDKYSSINPDDIL